MTFRNRCNGEAEARKPKNVVGKMLVATDFSPAAERALEHALTLACKHSALVRLVHASPHFETESEDAGLAGGQDLAKAQPSASQDLEAVAERLRDSGLNVQAASLAGPSAAGAIVEDASAFGADLIVLGTRGQEGWRRMPSGSTARQVVEHAPCPVLVVHELDPVPTWSRRTVVVATDFSECAREAALEAAKILALGVSDLVVYCHALRNSAGPVSSLAPVGLAEVTVAGLREAEKRLEQEAETFRAAGFGCRTEVLHGDPAETLIARSPWLDADLVVVGSVGRIGLSHFLHGSTAERLLSRSSCPVLVVPDPAIAASGHVA